ncbi:MAG: DsbA family oxidoreductase [Alphaproteobacteria bacterium]|jgi:predicted DsbA family dithiol-disulfide isomerase
MLIDIISDVVCPWCYVGKRRLEAALAARPDLSVEIAWHAFQLNPGMPEEGMDRENYLATKFGGADRAASIYSDIEQAGATEGIEFAFDAIKRTPNTINAHRLILLAGRHGVQDSVVELLFRRYFLAGVDVGDIQQLIAIATEAGLDEAATRDYLESDEGVEEVTSEDRQMRHIGVTGVPCFIIDKRFAISGAQAPEVFQRIFDTAVAAEEEAAE